MKFTDLVIFSLLLFNTMTSLGQSGKRDLIFIAFDQSKDNYYLKETENGEMVKVETFIINEFPTGKVQFFIKGEMFIHDPSIMEGNSLKTLIQPDTKMLQPEEVLSHIGDIEAKYPLGPKFPSDEYPTLIIVVNGCSGNQRTYEVRWQPYQD